MESDRFKRPGKPASTPAEVLAQWLDGTIAELSPERATAHALPQDELHQEILLPLLPAMLGDHAIRQHWREQKGSGFFNRLEAHLHGGAPRPEWRPSDLEIHVTASYRAGADAKALADTLLSEESLRDLGAALLNQVGESAWQHVVLPPPIAEVPEESAPAPAPIPIAPTVPPTVSIEQKAATPEQVQLPPPAPGLMPAWNPLWRPLRRGGWIGGGSEAGRVAPNPLALRARGRLVWRSSGKL